jgi:hypothetical protein
VLVALTRAQAGFIWRVSTVIHSITVVVERHTTAVFTGELWPAARRRGGRNQHDDQYGEHQNHHPHPPGLEKSGPVSGAVSRIYAKCLKTHTFGFFLDSVLPTQCMFLPPTYYPTNTHSYTTHMTYKNIYMFRHHLPVPSSGNNYNKVVQPNLPIYVMFIFISAIKREIIEVRN